jgi:hypothetical protein
MGNCQSYLQERVYEVLIKEGSLMHGGPMHLLLVSLYLSLSLSSSGEQASKGARELCANHCDNELRSSVEGKVHVEYM